MLDEKEVLKRLPMSMEPERDRWMVQLLLDIRSCLQIMINLSLKEEAGKDGRKER